jgi:putative transposase
MGLNGIAKFNPFGARRGPGEAAMMTPQSGSYPRHRFPAEVISHAAWLYFRFSLSLRHSDGLLAAQGITVSHETRRQSTLK